ncbi:MAG: alkaline phosphatase family protein [Steroidobacterales bacterium]
MTRKTVVAALALVLSLPSMLPVDAQPVTGSANDVHGGRGLHDNDTASPIRHVIVIIGENRSFDHVFATYVPRSGQHVSNLLSRGIINADGTPGRNHEASAQRAATDTRRYAISPARTFAYLNIPPPGTHEAPSVPSDKKPAPFASIAAARAAEHDLANDYFPYLLTGATGLPPDVIDTRIANYENLGPGTFQLTPSVKYDDYAASPVHRFYQMWQQSDCSVEHASPANPSGCRNDLYAWVEVTAGPGSNGKPQPLPVTNIATGEGSTALEFYNMQQGDAPYLKQLAERYTLSDNMHQSVQGGTGANHIMFGFADAIWYSDGHGHPATPPANQIENPDPQPGTDNWYDEDGYAGGSYSACADLRQPGVSAVVAYLESLPRPINPRCEPKHYYLLNNYNPGFNADGTPASKQSPYTIPPSSVRHIGDVLMQADISFSYFGGDWNIYQTDPAGSNPYDAYCHVCNPFQYATDIMTNPALRQAHIHDTDVFYQDIADENLPAVSIVKPSMFVDGHPASSKLDLFEGFLKKIIEQMREHPKIWRDTAMFVTFDEGGGYYDSGYIQPLDFFGDGPRIPLLIVSAYTEGGLVDHGYADHVSIIKFIERNWHLKPITARSRDNFPNPKTRRDNPYAPTNSPALTDLWDAFHFAPAEPAH